MPDVPPLTALIVIADERQRQALDQPLRKAGFKIRDAMNGTEGLRFATELPDIIILDLRLPDMSGFEVCCRLKAHAATAFIPVLHLSDTPVESSEFAGHLERGDEAYLTHPVDAVELLACIVSLLRGRQTHRQFSSFLEAAPDAVVIVDQNGKVIRVNGQAEKMFGYVRDELVEQEVEILMPERFRERHRGQRDSFVAHPSTRPMGRTMDLWGLRKDGSEFPVEISLSAIPNHQGILVASIVRDVTERKRMEEKLRDADRKKDEFLAMLSHELRNPLAAIANAVQLLGSQKHEDKLQQNARTIIQHQVGQLTHLIDDLLEVSRITTGRFRLRYAQIELNDIVEHAVETVQPLMDQHGHKLGVSLSPQPILVYADATRLEQVAVNLLTNAAKYTADGGHVSIAVQKDGNEALLRVRDTGVGIGPELLPRIFELFTQAEGSLDRSQGGLGIGLWLVQQLVQIHGGKVEVTSVLGEGSEFVVRLPIMTTSSTQPSSSPEVVTEPTGPSLRVLVVDDNESAGRSLVSLLEMSGHEVRLATDGHSAIEAALSFRPNVVLLDIGLPGIDGFEVAKRLRRHSELSQVALVAMTGHSPETFDLHSHDANFNHYLIKPVSFQKVEKVLAIISENAS